MRPYAICFATAVLLSGPASIAYAASESGSPSTECAKLAPQFDAAARSRAKTEKWPQAEYYATEAKSDCETEHANAGVRAYDKAFDELGVPAAN